MTLRAVPEASQVIGRGLFLTGAMRSGTTMMARLIASLDTTEMFFEPPFSYLLIPMIEELEAEPWKLLFEFTLFEDYLLPALAGRNINLNKNDLSYIGHYKSQNEISERLSDSYRHQELVEKSNRVKPCFKMPEMMPYVEAMRHIYPHMAFLTTLRKPESCIASLLEKGWYSDDGLYGTTNKWPLKDDTERNLPFWLPNSEHDKWCNMNEIERCCYSYLHQYRSSDNASFHYIIDYDRFVEAPQAMFVTMVDAMGLTFGDRTQDLLSKVSEPCKKRDVDWGSVSPALRDEAFAIHDKWRSAATKF